VTELCDLTAEALSAKLANGDVSAVEILVSSSAPS